MTVVLTGIAHIVKDFIVSRVHKRTLNCMYCIVWCHTMVLYGIIETHCYCTCEDVQSGGLLPSN